MINYLFDNGSLMNSYNDLDSVEDVSWQDDVNITDFESEVNTLSQQIPSLECTSVNESLNFLSQISFGSHIDDLYDPSINSAQDDLIHHLEEATDAWTTDDLEYHLDKAEEARISEDYWKDAKRSAEIETEKHDIFIDGINEQWEIMDRYQSEMENIFKRK